MRLEFYGKETYQGRIHRGSRRDGRVHPGRRPQAVNNVVGALRKIFAEDNQDALSFSGFGSFRVNHNPARKGRNPRTGAEITIPAGETLKFKASKKLFQ